ncbi:hypothetical protein NHX12_031576 [Muraenolepis orangiensis]|uniref:BAH domain-containing protein n=1 Tax=Muraenolepis orangiensis TaxID=630683 RepID=A0A9Q0IKP8_9TELE|nr:hypothetical protein NHX12_031576 [Muraenolepis orangiensis]
MDGRDFGPPRSVHVPPPLLAGLAMESQRLGAAAAAGRIAPSPGHLATSHPPPLHSGKFMPSPINIHPHHSYSPLPSGLYPSPYLHLDPPALSQHPLYDSHKEGFYLPASISQSSLHAPSGPPPGLTSAMPPQRDGRAAGVEDRRARAAEAERERGREREREHSWPFHPHLQHPHHHHQPPLHPHHTPSSGEPPRPRPPPPASHYAFQHGVYLGPEAERGPSQDGEETAARPQHNSHAHCHPSPPGPSPPRPLPPAHTQTNALTHADRDRTRRGGEPGPLHMPYGLPPPLQPSPSSLATGSTGAPLSLAYPSAAREPIREQRVTAPTYVPSVEVYDERAGPIQIASQARDNKHKERERERESYRLADRDHSRPPPTGDSPSPREEGSVIRPNGTTGKRAPDAAFAAGDQSSFCPDGVRDTAKHSLRLEHHHQQQRPAEPKWTSMSPLTNYTAGHMAVLVAQHGHALSPGAAAHGQHSHTHRPHSPHTSPHGAQHQANHKHHHQSSHRRSPQTPRPALSSPVGQPGDGAPSTAAEDGGPRTRYLDPSALYHPGRAPGAGERGPSPGSDPGEVSAMQSLIKYSGNFPPDASHSSRQAPPETRGPFGGLGSLKREQERPDSARSFGREGEGEVRHPPVGIAVAVARQRDSGTTSKQNGGPPDAQRPLLQTIIKDEDRGDDRTRHHDDRLLSGRLEREQEKVLRESKELAEFTQMHPAPLSGGLTPSLGPSSLHQSLAPGYPPTLQRSMPSPYQFARDPQSGQLLVIPAEHLPHYGGGGADMLERGGGPVWPGVYGAHGGGGGASSLHHAAQAQLQLLSQQQMLRQHELLMIQQHTAQVLELQRNAQLVERLKAGQHRPEMEDKVEKRSSESKTRPPSVASPSPSPVPHLPRAKARPPSRSPPAVPPPLPTRGHLSSPLAPLKMEDCGIRERRHKMEAVPYQDLPPGYPYQSIPAPFTSQFPAYHHHHPPPMGATSEPPSHHPHLRSPIHGFALPGADLRPRDQAEVDIKPRGLHPPSGRAPLKQEPHPEEPRLSGTPPVLGPPPPSCSPAASGQEPEDFKEGALSRPPPPPIRDQSPSRPHGERQSRAESVEKEAGQIKMEVAAYPCQAPVLLPAPAFEAEPKAEVLEETEPMPYTPCIAADLNEAKAELTQYWPTPPPCEPRLQDPPHPHLHTPDSLLTASEMPQASFDVPAVLALLPEDGEPSLDRRGSDVGPLEVLALEGMALLSHMAQLEMERISQEQDLALGGLHCLLEASRQVLLEAIQKQSHIDLPRQLDPHKKYSWRQRKEEPAFSKGSEDVLDAVEVDYRIRLAELQKTYRDKQRDLSRLQRRRDRRERQQQEDERRSSLSRRGRGRPRKRKHLDTKPGKLARTVQYSEDSEAGEGQRKSWSEPEPSSSASLEVLKGKRGRMCEQEQLASDLSRALSLSQLGSLSTAARKLSSTATNPKAESKPKVKSSSDGRPRERSLHPSAKGEKRDRLAPKSSASESSRKGKGQKIASPFSAVRSELSSCSNNSYSEGEDSARGGWPPLSRSHDNLSRKRPRSSPSPSATTSQKPQKKKKHKHLSMLLEEAGLSSSDDSFDQESSEEDDGSEYEESGLGLLARFAASALPVKATPMTRFHGNKHRSRQSTLGSSECEWSDSGSDLRLRKFPSLLHGKRSAPELPLLPPPRPSPRQFNFDPGAGSGSGFCGFSEEEGWNRRRSERIFLHDATASANQSPPSSAPAVVPPPALALAAALSPKPPASRLKHTPPSREGKDLVKKKKPRDGSLPVCSPTPPGPIADPPAAQSLSPAPRSQSKAAKLRPRESSRGAVSRLMESMAADEDFEPNQDSSFSEDELLPLRTNSLSEGSATPAPVQCVLDKDSLVDGLRVLIPMDDQLLYAGHVNTVHSPDIYSVVVEGERGNRPHIYCLEQLLQEAIIDVKPPSARCLPEGSRIAAYWSQQYRCLYPGTVVNGSLDVDENDDLIPVEFDDGDTGAEPSPALLVASCSRRRVRKCSKEGGAKETSGAKAEDGGPKIKGRPGRKPKPKAESSIIPDGNREKSTPPSSSSQPSDRAQPPAKPAQDRPSFGQKAAQERPLSGSRPPSSSQSKPCRKSSSSSAASPLSPGLLPRKVLTVDLYSEPNLGSYASQRRGRESSASSGSGRLGSSVSPTSSRPLSRPSSGPKHGATTTSDPLSFGSKPRPGGTGTPLSRPNKPRPGAGEAGSGVRRKPASAEPLVKLDHEGVTSPKTKKTKALMLLEGRNISSSHKPLKPKVKAPERGAVPSEKEPTYRAVSREGREKPATGKGSGQRGRPPKPKPIGGEGKVGRPKRREGVHLPTTKELAKRQRLPSVENRPKISAFLPARQLWKWFGKPTQRRGMKGKAKKLFYKAIVRGREMIRIGDCAVFLSAGRPNLPFIGRIQSMWESWGSNMVVRVNWFYHPEETNPGKKLTDKKSSHSDENDVQTVSHKCLVASVEEYQQTTQSRRHADNEDLYYLAGTYEPTTGMIFNTDGVPVIC